MIIGLQSNNHDASLAVVDRQGRLLFAAEAERYRRVKRLGNLLPAELLAEALDYAPAGEVAALGISNLNTLMDPAAMAGVGRASLNAALASHCYGWGRFPALSTVLHVRHHDAHLLSAFAPSGFPEALVITLDGKGETDAVSVAVGREGRIAEPLLRLPAPQAGAAQASGECRHSLGLLYDLTTQWLGWGSLDDAGKTMALAGYGEPRLLPLLLAELVAWEEGTPQFALRGGDGAYMKAHAARRLFGEVLGPGRAAGEPFSQYQKDVAASVQALLERYLLSLVAWGREQSGCRRVCLAGGVAMNSAANGVLLRSGLVDELFVQPAAGDNGLAIGCAYAALNALEPYWSRTPGRRQPHNYLGSGYPPRGGALKAALEKYGLDYQLVDDAPRQAAAALARGEIVAWFQGRMELGARALGNRSILANPLLVDVAERVNSQVKGREPWRPFAPATTDERIGDYFEHNRPEPYMTVVYRVREVWRQRLPAVTHVDGSARVQSVSAEHNPRFHALIEAFGTLSGAHVVLNTSLNYRKEPVVRTPEEAVRLFLACGIDTLLLGDYLVQRKPAPLAPFEPLRNYLLQVTGYDRTQAVSVVARLDRLEALGGLYLEGLAERLRPLQQEGFPIAWQCYHEERMSPTGELLLLLPLTLRNLALGEVVALWREARRRWPGRRVHLASFVPWRQLDQDNHILLDGELAAIAAAFDDPGESQCT